MSLTVFAFHGLVAEPLEVHDFCFIDAATFHEQLLAIRARYDVIPLRTGLQALRDGSGEPAGASPRAALTFDDGFQSVFDLALPLLAELGLAASCFVSTAAIETGRPLWFSRIHRAISETRRPQLAWAAHSWALNSPGRREAASAGIQRLMKDLPGDYVDAETDHVSQLLEVDPDEPVDRASPYRPLDAESIEAMVRSGLVEFGAHGHRHMILSSIDPPAQKDEVVTSVEAVRDLTGQPADVFAYPNGQEGDYDDDTFAVLRGAGVMAALTATGGACSRESPPLALPRIMLDSRSWKERIA